MRTRSETNTTRNDISNEGAKQLTDQMVKTRIVSKHISDSSLYRYLNFGEKSAHERDKVLRLTQYI